MNESAADWGLVFDTLLLIAFLQSDAETPEAAAEKFAKKLLDIPENVDISRKRRKNGAHGVTSGMLKNGRSWRSIGMTAERSAGRPALL